MSIRITINDSQIAFARQIDQIHTEYFAPSGGICERQGYLTVTLSTGDRWYFDRSPVELINALNAAIDNSITIDLRALEVSFFTSVIDVQNHVNAFYSIDEDEDEDPDFPCDCTTCKWWDHQHRLEACLSSGE